MSVKVWYGDRSHHEIEQNALLELYQYLHFRREHFGLLRLLLRSLEEEVERP